MYDCEWHPFANDYSTRTSNGIFVDKMISTIIGAVQQMHYTATEIKLKLQRVINFNVNTQCEALMQTKFAIITKRDIDNS